MTKLRWKNDGRLKTFYVYVLSDASMTLYTGITNDLRIRSWQHVNKIGSHFTSRYDFDRIVYFEEFTDPSRAIAREKEIKGWRRQKKIDLIKAVNPHWKDLTPIESR